MAFAVRSRELKGGEYLTNDRQLVCVLEVNRPGTRPGDPPVMWVEDAKSYVEFAISVRAIDDETWKQVAVDAHVPRAERKLLPEKCG